MENQSDRPVGFQGLVQWATTPPQAYATYFVALILIGGLSFYAGTLKPKKVPSLPPPSAAAPLPLKQRGEWLAAARRVPRSG